MIATIFEGAGGIDNLVPMDATLNRSGWKKMENAWAKALEEGKEVDVKIEAVYNGTSKRPDSFNVEYKVSGKNWVRRTFKN